MARPVTLEKKTIRYCDAAEALGVSTRTIRRWVSFGLLPVLRVTQRTVFVSPEAIESLRISREASGKRSSTSGRSACE
jgi:predicted site-specific integrase-resolvase